MKSLREKFVGTACTCLKAIKAACLPLAAVMLASTLQAATVVVDRNDPLGPVKPVNGVGQPPMVGALGDWPMLHYLKEAGIPYSRLHDVGGGLGGGLYVDIPNLFPDFDADPEDPASYRFAYTDDLVSALVKNGVEPFFRLGVTIENFVERGFPPVNTLPPRDYGKWALVCEHVIRHYTEGWANGFRHHISHWEIWNEPDNMPDAAENAMWHGTFEEFLRLYGVVAPALKRRFPHLKIGGYGSCGFYAGVGSEQVKAANSSPRMAYFIDCATNFLATAQSNGWPLDFFSYHSYSDPTNALRQVRYADGLLNRYGFTADRCERVFNEWLCHVGYTATAFQAAGVAAELIELQNGPCDVACIYDARCDNGAYAPLFDPMTCKPRKAYDAFLAFNELRKLGTAVRCTSSDAEVHVAAACRDGVVAVMLANETPHEIPLVVKGLSARATGFVTDETRSRGFTGIPSRLPPHAVVLLSEAAFSPDGLSRVAFRVP